MPRRLDPGGKPVRRGEVKYTPRRAQKPIAKMRAHPPQVTRTRFDERLAVQSLVLVTPGRAAQTPPQFIGMPDNAQTRGYMQAHMHNVAQEMAGIIPVGATVTNVQMYQESTGPLRYSVTFSHSYTGSTYTMNAERDAWGLWVNSATVTTNHQDLWLTWTDAGITRTTAQGLVWDHWHDVHVQDDQMRESRARQQLRGAPAIITPERQRELDRIRREDHARRMDEAIRLGRERREKEEKANKRAEELLFGMLSIQQARDYREKGYFLVRAPRSGRLYRIQKGTHGNVKVVNEENQILEDLCIQPSGVPVADANLAQKLMIETNEEAFRAIANITVRATPGGHQERIIYGRPQEEVLRQ